MTPEEQSEYIGTVRFYHNRTKHHYHKFARSTGYLDWATQPDPFRRYNGAPLTPLPLTQEDTTAPYDALYHRRSAAAPITLASVGAFLERSLALSAWKSFEDSQWSLRCNPSSGNLHPTEGYLVMGRVPGLDGGPGVYHYAPLEHGLEQRASLPEKTWMRLVEGFPEATVLAGLTSIYWREAWKYGERAFRYCQHDVGHALAALAYSAAVLGWRAVLLSSLSDENVSALLGLDRTRDFGESEREHADLVAALVPAEDVTAIPRGLDARACQAVAEARWTGHANLLSPQSIDWNVIDAASEAARKTAAPIQALPPPPLLHQRSQHCPLSAHRIIQQRRSAVEMDGQTRLSCESFYTMLDRTLPASGTVPWDSLDGPPQVHLGLFVHRVEGLAPGLYFFSRDAGPPEALRAALRARRGWSRVQTCPESLGLFLLEEGDFTPLATSVSCGQTIAGDGAFSVAMIANFEEALAKHGAWYYRRLFWETGLIGQVLYLEAEAAGLRATGIGCFFDDAVHEVFGIEGGAYQSLYHFTVGGPIEDTRLTTLDPYPAGRRSGPGH